MSKSSFRDSWAGLSLQVGWMPWGCGWGIVVFIGLVGMGAARGLSLVSLDSPGTFLLVYLILTTVNFYVIGYLIRKPGWRIELFLHRLPCRWHVFALYALRRGGAAATTLLVLAGVASFFLPPDLEIMDRFLFIAEASGIPLAAFCLPGVVKLVEASYRKHQVWLPRGLWIVGWILLLAWILVAVELSNRHLGIEFPLWVRLSLCILIPGLEFLLAAWAFGTADVL